MRRITALFAALLGLITFLLVARTASATVISGGDIIDQTWGPAGNPYVIQGDVTVPSGSTLTIEAGTVVQIASTDALTAGLDTARVELTVHGTLVVDGSAQTPVTFEAQINTVPSAWYGIVIASDAQAASVEWGTVRHAVYGVRSSAPGTTLSVFDTTFQSNQVGVYVDAGTPALERVASATNTSHGFQVHASATPAISDCIARSNGGHGILVHATGASASNLLLSGCTLHANVGSGLFVQADAGASAVVELENANVTRNLYGINRSTVGGTTAVSVTYSNVWRNHQGAYVNAAGGVGTFAANPLYVAAPANLRLTENSPSRYAGDGGQDIGALPYVDNPTNGLHGTLWSDRTLTQAGSPHDVAGDLTVAPGVTLTIEPGAYIRFASGTDVMEAYADPARAELRVLGTLEAVGSAELPIRFTSPGSLPSWYGVVLQPTAVGSNLDRIIIERAVYGIRHLSSTGSHTLRRLVLQDNEYGVYADDGVVALEQLTVRTSGLYGIYLTGGASGSVVNTVVRNSEEEGIHVFATGGASSSLLIQNCTIHQNRTGMNARAEVGASTTVTVRNTIVTNNGRGLVRSITGGTVAVASTYTNVWSNLNGDYVNNTPGVGELSADPDYVSPTNFLQLSDGSVCIDAGTSTGAPAIDRDGIARPQDGDGLNGAQPDMGAYEFFVYGECGDGTQQPNEACDDGGDNGEYGFCLADCSGPGPSCGDGTTDADDEECDDGNASNTDDCLDDCTLAQCGDGFLREGSEECDDGNGSNADACLNTCAFATCGDAFVQQGTEECDDGNDTQTDGCLEDCTDAVCGDGFTRTGFEDCDDGNSVDDDQCANDCTLATCGDGVTQVPEGCDDGNVSNHDACLNTCQAAACGDGFVQTSVEQCDDGNEVDSDSCSNACVGAACGDGVKQSSEACDDGNASNTDACLEGCKAAACGDGHVRVGEEECDDANGVSGDGCAPDCTLENAGEGGGGAGGQGQGVGGLGSAGEGGGGNPSGGDGDGAEESGGCRCGTVGTTRSRPGSVVALLGLGLWLARRRRRAA